MLQAQRPKRKNRFCHVCGESCYGFYCHNCFVRHNSVRVNKWVRYRESKGRVINDG